MKRNVRRQILAAVIMCIWVFALTGCSHDRNKTEKIRDLDFTVISEDNLPEELKGILEEKKVQEFKVTYQDNGFLYICIGYGQQQSGGYSIRVNDLYLTENAVYADTTLIGPEPEEQTKAREGGHTSSPSYPYIVLKTEHVDKSVVFN